MSRRFGLFLVFAAALPLAIVSTAWACGVLATVKLDKRVASAGDTVNVTGKNYTTAAGSTPVTIRLKSRTGTVLATTTVDGANNISDSFVLPTGLASGWYIVMATQFNANGTVKTGTPARTTIRIQGRSAAATAVSPWNAATPSGPGDSAIPVAGDGGQTLPVVLAAFLSLGLLAGGVTLVGRRARTARRPHLSV